MILILIERTWEFLFLCDELTLALFHTLVPLTIKHIVLICGTQVSSSMSHILKPLTVISQACIILIVQANPLSYTI